MLTCLYVPNIQWVIFTVKKMTNKGQIPQTSLCLCASVIAAGELTRLAPPSLSVSSGKSPTGRVKRTGRWRAQTNTPHLPANTWTHLLQPQSSRTHVAAGGPAQYRFNLHFSHWLMTDALRLLRHLLQKHLTSREDHLSSATGSRAWYVEHDMTITSER